MLEFYPNPASTIINTEKGKIEILDALGNPVLVEDSKGQVDVSKLKTGIYLISQNRKIARLIIY